MRRFFAAAAAVLAGGLVACAAPARSDRPADAIVLGAAAEPDHLNPVLGFAADGGSKIFDGLVALDQRLQVTPALAETLPRVSSDGLTITYTLRSGVTFHDGTALTAHDVVFTYQAVRDPGTNSTLRAAFDALRDVRATDDRTVVFRLRYPYAPFVTRTTLGIVPARALSGVDVDTAGFNRRPVGTGPYRLESWTSGEKMVLVANDAYWGGAPAVKRVTIAFVADDNVRAARLRSGELDGADLPAKIADRFADTAGYRRYDVPSADYRIVNLPLEHPVTADPAIRRAVDLAVDRAALVRTVLGGQGQPGFGLVSPAATEWYEASLTRPASAQRDRAAQVLERAGWRLGGDGIRVRDGRRAAFTLMYAAGDSLRKDLATAVASDARRVGIDVTLTGLDWSAISPRLGRDAVIYGGGTPYDPDYDLYDMLHSSRAGEGWANPGRYRSPTVDALLDRARRSGDRAERSRLYRQVQAAVAGDAPIVGLVFIHHTYLLRDAWTGVSPRTEAHEHFANGLYWNLHAWVPR
ncbi:MAG TPA: ABC transporter substrate-binding protein [Pilimelia sp.]|nr:ABC transporter substrate-binding protein [Pilimelia sp.]